MKRSSPLLFSICSIIFILLILWFVSLTTPGQSWDENIASLNENWNSFNSLSTIWRLEALIVCGIAFAAFNMSDRSRWWNLVAIGHVLMLSEYIFMLGGYKEVASEESFQILNEMANWAFVTSNLIWIVGMLGVYWGESKARRIIGVLLSVAGAALIGAIFFGIGSLQRLTPIAMPVVLLLYILNAYYGIWLYLQEKKMA